MVYATQYLTTALQAWFWSASVASALLAVLEHCLTDLSKRTELITLNNLTTLFTSYSNVLPTTAHLSRFSRPRKPEDLRLCSVQVKTQSTSSALRLF